MENPMPQHHHHHAGRPHPPAAVPVSILRLSAAARLCGAAVLAGILWLAVCWAING
jgi:hypothetical protein